MLYWKLQLLIGNVLDLTLSLGCRFLSQPGSESGSNMVSMACCHHNCIFFFCNSSERASCWGAGQGELCIDTFVQACVTQLDKVLFFPHFNDNGDTFARVLWLCTCKKRHGGGMWMRLKLRFVQVLGRGWCTMWECSENIYRKCVLLASLECQDMCGS